MNPIALLAEALERVLGVTADSVGSQQWQRAVAQRAGQRGLAAEAYAVHAAGDGGELVALLDALRIDESWLQRDPAQLAAIGTTLRQRVPGAVLSLLCAPCARGEEAWTLAAMLHEQGHRAPHARIVAVDLAAPAIRQAKTGLLPRAAWRDASPLPWWLHPAEGDQLRVDAALRPLVQFETGNLLEWQPRAGGPFDLVCTRNFLIYLGTAAQQRWLERLGAWLAPGGSVWTARSERIDRVDPRFVADGPDNRWVFRAIAGPDPAPPPPVVSMALPRRARPAAAAPVAAAAPAPQPVAATPAAPAPADKPLALALALAAMQRDELVSAEALLRQVLFLDRDCEEALLHLAALRTRQGDVAEAQRLHARLRRLGRAQGAPA